MDIRKLKILGMLFIVITAQAVTGKDYQNDLFVDIQQLSHNEICIYNNTNIKIEFEICKKLKCVKTDLLPGQTGSFKNTELVRFNSEPNNPATAHIFAVEETKRYMFYYNEKTKTLSFAEAVMYNNLMKIR